MVHPFSKILAEQVVPEIWIPNDSRGGVGDYSGNGYIATPVAVSVGGGAALLPTDNAGSTEFDGAGDYITTDYTTRRNLIPNPSFETGVSGWTGVSSSGDFTETTPLEQSAAWSSSRDYSAHIKLTKGATSDASSYVIRTATGVSGMPVTADLTDYTLSVRANVLNAAATGIRLELRWYDSGGALLSTSTDDFSTATGEETWVLTAQPPVGAVYASAEIRISSSTSGDVVEFYFDAVLFEHASSAGSYFDGASVGCGWLGTAHASASDRGCFANGRVTTFGGLASRGGSAALHPLFSGSPSTRFYLPSGTDDVRADLDTAGGVGSDVWSGAWPGNDRDVFWVFTVDEPSDEIELHINGASAGTVSGIDQFPANSTLSIGIDNSSNYWLGSMQHFFVVEGEVAPRDLRALTKAARAGVWG